MALYSSPSNCTGPLTEVVCNDDEGSGLRSAFLVSLSAGVQYYAVIWVWGTNAPATNAASIQLRVSRPIAPTNDTCATAQMIPAGGQFPYFTPIADLTNATVEAWYGDIQFESRIMDFLEREATDEDRAALRALRPLVLHDEAAIDAWIDGLGITKHREAALVYFLLHLMALGHDAGLL